MVSVVNGYVCLTTCDAAAARRGADPRNPTKDPVKQELLDRNSPTKALERDRDAARPSVTGESGDATGGQGTRDGLGPLASGVGTVLDRLA